MHMTRVRSSISGWTIRLKGGRLHILLLAILIGELLAARINHRAQPELQALLDSGPSRQRAYALFVLTNRGPVQPPDRETIRKLLQSDEVLLREWTMTANFTRFAPPLVQESHIGSLGGSGEAVRCRFWLYYRPAGGSLITLADLKRFLDADRPGF